ncbi:pyridoxal phosphate-dependent aminotransferase [Glaciimonas sp. Gout2]|uniref:pyridoxal phosphate-dependent aminotransferase n=1 Tax=unclassified Glaciimonas TaxID=2644401 RepID=UPI002B236539|nr:MULTISPECIES: pyridoxal phosphate-dependent aminotransferase [unclassified Glaciimonas]MEB0010712.1 pyridoxal phosphate-dependent aminotransferase [Glaciimonas sp. Cout2]MEB0082152.1 pyridoxal phosphate-dependent aminotransferase [Glaciimonas sp. Gout2]
MVLSPSPSARLVVQSLEASRIREVANVGIGRSDVLPFWFGEPDQVTPAFIRDAAKAALDDGDTFYTSNYGIPPLREALAGYLSALHQPLDASRVAVTSSGVSALMLLSQLILSPGDRVVAVTPLWPNVVEIPKILGAEVVRVPLQFGEVWDLDIQQLIDALTPGTRAVMINSPNNPTGWVMSRAQQKIVLDHCRQHGIWIVADDVYERVVYRPSISGRSNDTQAHDDKLCAPSFLDIAEPNDRLISSNSFSKAWLMTGWRLGWLVAPPTLMTDLGKLIEFNTSCAPGFVQRAGIAAVERGDDIIATTIDRYQTARDFLYQRLNALPGITAPLPKGAMYLFFRLDGVTDSLALCKQLVRDAGLGLAPGSAFGPEGEGYIRWCFASSVERLASGVQRLEKFLLAR